MAFLDHAVLRLTGRRVAAPVVDTVWLARRLLEGRTKHFGLARLSHFFGTSAEPCHRALPDAAATAEILIGLIGLAQERGAETVADLVDLSAPRARRLHAKRSLVAGAPRGAGTYIFRDVHGQPLYVGRARDLSARLRSYFSGERQRPAVEAALGALAQVEWQRCGSELEAALDELRLLRELRPPANARGTRPDRHVYLRRRGSALGVRERADAARAAFQPDARPPRRAGAGRVRGRRSARCAPGPALAPAEARRPIFASRMPRGCATGSPRSNGSQSGWTSSRAPALCAPVSSCRRSIPAWCARSSSPARWSSGARSRAGVALVSRSRPGSPRSRRKEAGGTAPEVVDELLLIASFLRRPPPELHVVALDRDAVIAAVNGVALAA